MSSNFNWSFFKTRNKDVQLQLSKVKLEFLEIKLEVIYAVVTGNAAYIGEAAAFYQSLWNKHFGFTQNK